MKIKIINNIKTINNPKAKPKSPLIKQVVKQEFSTHGWKLKHTSKDSAGQYIKASATGTMRWLILTPQFQTRSTRQHPFYPPLRLFRILSMTLHATATQRGSKTCMHLPHRSFRPLTLKKTPAHLDHWTPTSLLRFPRVVQEPRRICQAIHTTPSWVLTFLSRVTMTRIELRICTIVITPLMITVGAIRCPLRRGQLQRKMLQ